MEMLTDTSEHVLLFMRILTNYCHQLLIVISIFVIILNVSP